ncbi:hypothetical protein BMS3Bbin04_01073 [bacterium BMS3Bbin04]|nr:hypothetical protein BMS3Bbin04_01073 [bacterium BMS3Bbin04]
MPGGGYIITGDTRVAPSMYGVRTIRTDEDGNEIWSMVENGGETDGVSYIEPTSDGGFIQGGSTLSYSPNFTWEGYVRKLNAGGETEWARLIGTNNIDDWVACVREVPSGGYVAVGVDNAQWFLWRMGPQGQYMWERHLPYEFDTRANFVEPLADGGFIVAGNYPDGFNLIKTDSQGLIVWQNEYFDGGWAYCARELPNGNIVASGQMWYSQLAFAWEVIMVDHEGNVIWTHEIDEEDTNTSFMANECWVMADGNIVVCGMGQDEELFFHRWIIKYDLEGNVLWHKIIPDGELFTVCQGRDGGIVVGGLDHTDIWHSSIRFRIYKLEPEVEIDLQPDLTVIPEDGGWLTYDAEINNILVNTTTMDTWTFIVNQNGNGTVVNPSQITLEPGIPYNVEDITIEIPAEIPDGEYTCEYHIGNITTDQNMGLGAFTFWKGEVGVDDPSGPGNGEDMKPGDESPGYPDDNPRPGFSETGLPDAFTVSAHPNPFNALTTITLSLPQPGDVRVTVYNALGQEVVLLNDTLLPAGTHSFTLDATNMASGLYFVRATVWDRRLEVTSRATHRVQKVLLVR